MLVLGSLPGQASLAAGQYYAHPRNQFWPLIGEVIGQPALPGRPYQDRLAALAEAGVGLWDVFASAVRAGSLDSAIRDGEAAALADLAASLPDLCAVAFNGKAAARAGRRALEGFSLTLVDLPSSSPAYAALPFAAKRAQWIALRRFLNAVPKIAARPLNPPAAMDIGK